MNVCEHSNDGNSKQFQIRAIREETGRSDEWREKSKVKTKAM